MVPGKANNTVTWLPAHPAEGWFSMFNYWNELAAACRPGDPFQVQCPLSLSRWRRRREGRMVRALNRFVLYPRAVKRLRPAGIVHVLDQSSAYLLDHVAPGCPTVVTVHDLIPLVFRDELSDAQVARYRRVVERIRDVSAVVAVSRYTSGEVERLLGMDPSKIHVVPNGVCHADAADCDWSGARELENWRATRGGLVIGYVGSALPRKNLPVLAESLGLLAERGVQFAFARVGEALPGPLQARFAGAVPTDSRFEFEGLGPGELAAYYGGVDVVVLPSTYEGFGLPVLEAMQFGVPVVCSDATSLPEVGGEAALYFSPDDPAQLAGHLEALQDPDRRAELGDRGKKQAARFSWRKHLEGLFEVYARILPSSQKEHR